MNCRTPGAVFFLLDDRLTWPLIYNHNPFYISNFFQCFGMTLAVLERLRNQFRNAFGRKAHPKNAVFKDLVTEGLIESSWIKLYRMCLTIFTDIMIESQIWQFFSDRRSRTSRRAKQKAGKTAGLWFRHVQMVSVCRLHCHSFCAFHTGSGNPAGSKKKRSKAELRARSHRSCCLSWALVPENMRIWWLLNVPLPVFIFTVKSWSYGHANGVLAQEKEQTARRERQEFLAQRLQPQVWRKPLIFAQRERERQRETWL